MQIRLPIVALLAWLVLGHPAPAWSDAPQPAADAIAALLARDSADADAASLRAFYAARNDAPAWSDPAQVAALADALAKAADQGLDFALPKAPAEGATAARDVALSRLALASAAALAKGRVPLDQLEQDWAIPAPSFDAAAGLSAALKHDLAAWFASLPPQHPYYQRLVGALARYRAIAAGGGWAQVPRGEPLKLGMTGERVRAARKRLEAEGDLAPLAPQRRPRPRVRPRRRRVRSSMSAPSPAARPRPKPRPRPTIRRFRSTARWKRRCAAFSTATASPSTARSGPGRSPP